ncbi:MAG: ATP-binding cassette domain-containing protein [Anaerolineales bacterium]|nr:ATP-binding cassette domain-containing protein [Anaerolineales bacterium]
MDDQPLLQAVNLSKQFGNLAVLQNVNLKIRPGEVVGLAGRSGAGKSVLIKILAGLQSPDAGDLYLEGRRLQRPFQAQAHGINVIHQEPELIEQLDVTSNIFLGHETSWPFFPRWLQIPNQRKMDEEARQLLLSLDVEFSSLQEKAVNLSSEKRQLVAIAQVMARPSKVILIDDPSLLLSLPYQERLLGLVRTWQKKGIAVLFSSHNLDHLFAVTDRIIVVRQGKMAGDFRTDAANRERIVAALVGTADQQQRTPVIWALDSYYRARKQAETLRHNQMLLRRDLKAQGNLNQQLVEQLAHQVKALDSANLALQDAQRRLLTEREQERKRLARELHDQMIQDLLSLNYDLEEMEAKAKGLPALQEDFVEMRHNIRAMVEDLRRICGNLRPPTIDSLGLGAALKSYLHDWSHRTGIEVKLEIDDNFGRLPEAIELSIFRIIQEGVNNIWKHAEASQAEIVLKQTSPRMLSISIADNGIGLQTSFDLGKLSDAGHFGLLGLSERVALLGGRMQFRNLSDSGLLINVEIPHPRMTPQEQLGYPLPGENLPIEVKVQQN